MDLGVLDDAIALVIIILMLSMVVQSLQSFIKKLSKFKSRQIEASLQKLFDQVKESAPPGNAANASRVLDHFRQLGRANTFGRHAVESISKADLSKVVTSIEGSSLVPEKAKEAIASFFASVKEVQQAADALAAIQLAPASVARLTELRNALAPLAAHVKMLFDDQGNLNAKLIVSDVLSLRDFKGADVLKIVSDLETQIGQAAAADPGNAVLQNASKAAKDLAESVAELSARLAQVVARLRERVDALESWYDTVMQGFEERYARHMKTWAFILSLAVAVVLNADIFQIYRRLATDDIAKKNVLNRATAIQASYEAQIKRWQDNPDPNKNPDTLENLKEKLNDSLDEAAQSYQPFGLEPLNFENFGPWTIPGWIFMAFLLSLGAPFWHDTLESLFGLKNYLRQAGQIQKVEQKSGEGMTKT